MEGETRFSKIGAISESASRAELAALDLKQLFLAMTEEVLASHAYCILCSLRCSPLNNVNSMVHVDVHHHDPC